MQIQYIFSKNSEKLRFVVICGESLRVSIGSYWLYGEKERIGIPLASLKYPNIKLCHPFCWAFHCKINCEINFEIHCEITGFVFKAIFKFLRRLSYATVWIFSFFRVISVDFTFSLIFISFDFFVLSSQWLHCYLYTL